VDLGFFLQIFLKILFIYLTDRESTSRESGRQRERERENQVPR